MQFPEKVRGDERLYFPREMVSGEMQNGLFMDDYAEFQNIAAQLDVFLIRNKGYEGELSGLSTGPKQRKRLRTFGSGRQSCELKFNYTGWEKRLEAMTVRRLAARAWYKSCGLTSN